MEQLQVINYSSADSLPLKLIKNISHIIIDGKITPYNIKLSPTNKCNSNCSWCSLSNRNRKMELDINDIKKILEYFSTLGTKSIDLSGGGEPTLHKNYLSILSICNNLNLKIGLVTNGIILNKKGLTTEITNRFVTWSRMTIIETVSKYNTDLFKSFCENLPIVDCSCSFVVTKDANYNTIANIIKLFDNLPNFSHFRLVSNILDCENPDLIKTFTNLKNEFKHPNLIFQDRLKHTKGTENCLISLLKPQINADGYIYPCCGVQYAIDNSCDESSLFKMCYWSEFDKIKHFNGAICKKCYYNDYNLILNAYTTDFKHEEFI